MDRPPGPPVSGLLLSLTLVVSAVGSLTLGLGLGAGTASANSCVPGVCGVTNVNFREPGSVGLPGGYCGIENGYAPIGAKDVDSEYDDPAGLGGGENEGNYPDSEVFQFKPATTLSGGSANTITVTLPHPSLSGGGSVLPPVTLPAYTPEQSGATVSVIASYAATTSPNNDEEAIVEVNLPPADANDNVELDAFDPYRANPLTPTGHGNGGTSVNFVTPETTAALGTAAYFFVTDSQQEEVTFAATDTSTSEPLVQTASFGFNGDITGTTGGGGPNSGQLGEQCASTLSSPEPTQASPYLLVDKNNNAQFVPTVNVTDASGFETATITVPTGFIPAQSGDQVTLYVLDAVSPTGIGTPNKAASSSDAYPQSDFSIQTAEDPVPSYPNNVPTFVGDYSNKLFDYPVAQSTSTAAVSSTTAQVSSSGGPTDTVTLEDIYGNPVNNKQVSVFPFLTSTHASVQPQGSPPSGDNYPATGDNGQAVYSVTDECAESVELENVDVDDQVQIFPFPSITFTPGPPVAPDAEPATRPCGPTQSSVTASTPSTPATSATPVSLPADGATQATVSVTLADQYGNIDACQLVALTPNTQNAVVKAQPPTHPCAAPDNGPGYSGTDGVATFTVTDSHVENVTLGVIDESSSALWPSTSANPFDVAQLDFLGADPGQSTLTPASQNAPATGTAQITVSLKDSQGAPLAKANQVITLAGCTAACTGSNTDPTTTVAAHAGYQTNGSGGVFTDSNGQAVFDVSDSSSSLPRTVFYQATDVTTGTVITQEAQVTFTMGGGALSASPSTVVADGTGASTLTFTLTNTAQLPQSGATVTLTSPSSTVGISPTAAPTTNAGGQVQFTVTDTKAETPAFTATATFASSAANCPASWSAGTCTVKATTNVVFLSPPTSLAVAVNPSSVPADGISTSQVTVTALAGSTPISGLEVELVASGSPAATSAVMTPPDAITGSNGQATFAVSDTVAGLVTFTPEYSDAQSATFLACTGACTPTTAQVTFTLTESEASTLSTTNAEAPADGSSTVCVEVTLSASSPIAGHAVALVTSSATTNVTPFRSAGCTGANVGAVSNALGQVWFSVTDTNPEPLLLYARDLYTGVLIGEATPLDVTFVQTEAQASTVTAAPTVLPAGGPTSTITVTLEDGTGTPFVGDSVSLSASSATVKLPVAPASTNGSGVVTFQVSDSAVETVTITAKDLTRGTTVLQTASITFTRTEAQQSSVAINPVTTPASGPAATLTVTLRNGLGQPISGDQVVVEGATGTTTVTPLLTGGVSNSLGVAQFSVSDTAIQTETLSACDTTVSALCTQASGALLSQTATISFSASEANESTMTSALSTLPAFVPGCTIPPAATWLCPTTTITVTLKNVGGAAISGHVVSLSTPSKTVLISPATATTNASGQATFTVGDSAVEGPIVFTALDRTTGSVVVKTVSISFTANEANQSTITGTPGTGAVTWTITVTLLDQNDHPLVGKTVSLTTGSAYTKVTILTKPAVTNAAGQIQFQMTDLMTQNLSVTAKDVTDNIVLDHPLAVAIYK